MGVSIQENSMENTNITKILIGGEEDWLKIAKQLMFKALLESTHTREVKTWTPAQMLLGLDSFQTKLSSTLDRMLKIWYRVRKQLKWIPGAGYHPLKATPKFFARVVKDSARSTSDNCRMFTSVCRKTRVHNTKDIWEQPGNQNTLLGKIQTHSHVATPAIVQNISTFDQIFPADMAMDSLAGCGWMGVGRGNPDRHTMLETLDRPMEESPV
ncbi:hypothetical protein R1sor_014566 [Riccia sorocarpa]|uniref:Uncharacterized protein n=1 Tax=Riccia sorocarpa TaxID=122646 RepID=A0ABD3HCS0_9MARC